MTTTSADKWQHFRTGTYETIQYLKIYFKNPIQAMRHIPDWSWPRLLFLYTAIAALCGALSGLVAMSFTQFLGGLLVLPLSATAIHFIVAGFFYYTFLFFFREEIPLRPIFTVLILANIPMMFLIILSPLIPPVNLLGLIISALLLIVGFVENFRLPRAPIIKLISAMYLLYFALWVFSMIQITKKKETFHHKATPESLDILERELKGE